MFSPDSSTTGMPVTGLTSPTFTLAKVVSAVLNAAKFAVTALGGTQTNATANSITSPFTVSFAVPGSLQKLPAANPLTGLRGSIPRNRYNLTIYKGGQVASGVYETAAVRLQFDIPAGMESYDTVQLRSMLSFLGGLLTEEADDIIDTFTNGSLPTT